MKKKKSDKIKLIIIIIAIALVAGLTLLNQISNSSDSEYQNNIVSDSILSGATFPSLSALKTIPDSEIKTNDKGEKYTTDPSKIKSGGVPRGGIGIDRGIPALAEKNIKFVSVQSADSWIQDDELVLALEHKGVERVYPLQILTWHEIANDVVAGDPIAVTYCPLCGSGIAYFRVIDGQPVNFGTSGKLFNSNLVMYDDLTESYWQQIDGKAITGISTGFELQELSVDTVLWKDWKEAHPNSQVLSQDTGINRNYGRDPYASYFENDFLFSSVENEDSRIKPKTPIVGIEISGSYKAYRESDLSDPIEDTLNGVPIKIEKLPDGKIVIINLDTNEEIVKEQDFWFAWYAFHPETELYGF
jgi:hypothetical protein